MMNMSRALFVLLTIFCLSDLSAADRTLRVDYVFSGTDRSSEISLDRMFCFDGWAGRRTNLDRVPVRGNGQICMTEAATGDTLYRQSFSTLFQEWQTTEEATHVRRAFENVFLLPMPEVKSYVEVEIYDPYGNVSASLKHEVEPSDILIRHLDPPVKEHRYILRSGDPSEKIDVLIAAEGYTDEEKDDFYQDASAAVEAILAHEPFGSFRDRFNFVAVPLCSADSGVSVPGKGEWKDTALKAHFDTFYMDRYLTTLAMGNLHDQLCGVPYEHIIILANTDVYGGGGVYNSYTLTTAGHRSFKPVVVHEFGHSFAGLADEYYYDDQYVESYFAGSEPWEQNITTMADFGSKWKDMLDAGQAQLYEGGGYQSKGVWRPAADCRMHTNTAEDFCPVCRRAISRIIMFYTE